MDDNEELENSDNSGGADPDNTGQGDGKPEITTEAFNKVLAQRKQERDKRIGLEEELKDPAKLEARLAQLRPKKDETPQKSLDIKSLHKLMGVIKDLDEDEVDFITTYATGLGKQPEEVVSHEQVKTYLEAKREKRRQEKAVPEPSNRAAPVIEGKTFNQLTADEKKKHFSLEGWRQRRVNNQSE